MTNKKARELIEKLKALTLTDKDFGGEKIRECLDHVKGAIEKESEHLTACSLVYLILSGSSDDEGDFVMPKGALGIPNHYKDSQNQKLLGQYLQDYFGLPADCSKVNFEKVVSGINIDKAGTPDWDYSAADLISHFMRYKETYPAIGDFIDAKILLNNSVEFSEVTPAHVLFDAAGAGAGSAPEADLDPAT